MQSSSPFIQVGPSWPGFERIKHLVIFGASYCQTVLKRDEGPTKCSIPAPTAKQPLGVEFPGETYDSDGPNWVGHLISRPSQPQGTVPQLVYNYAFSGHKVPEVGRQIEYLFLRDLRDPGRSEHWGALKGDNTLFFTWIGINDVATAVMTSRLTGGEKNIELSFKKTLTELFEYQDKVYKGAGGRNFVFINHPPTHRIEGLSRDPKPIEMWNTALGEHVKGWAKKHADCTVMIYSSWDTFNRVLNELSPAEPDTVWADELHPTSSMHKIVAEDLEKLLMSQPAQKGSDE